MINMSSVSQKNAVVQLVLVYCCISKLFCMSIVITYVIFFALASLTEFYCAMALFSCRLLVLKVA